MSKKKKNNVLGVLNTLDLEKQIIMESRREILCHDNRTVTKVFKDKKKYNRKNNKKDWDVQSFYF